MSTPPNDRPTGMEIALIGMAGRFPGAGSVDALWRLLEGGVDALTRFGQAELEAAGVPAELRTDPRYVPVRGTIEGYDRFDAGFFGMTARESSLTDPQHRVFLETAWEALEDAGYDPARFGGRIGVFAGCGQPGYLKWILGDPRRARGAEPIDLRLGCDRDFLTTRVSYRMGLEGPSVNVQSACSTSLVAVHLACQSLLAGECDVALAGGVTVLVPHTGGYLYREGSINSPDGRTRAFDAAARGTVAGSGAGVVVLRRLEDAEAADDSVRALVLGSAVTNDGGRKIGFTAPGVDGQARAVRAALAVAGVDPATVGMVEAHGSGTELGDPVEVAALAEVFGGGRPGTVALGSVKTNLGHLDAAAGVAGLIKTVLSLQHRLVPPSLHFERPNPAIPFARTPFFVNTAPREWATDEGAPRRAGVSAFGLGGTNAHVVLEEAPAAEPSSPSSPWQLLVISAKSTASLEAATDRLAAHLRASPGVPLADAAWTLAVGRQAFAHRRALLVHADEDAAALLEARAPGRLLEGLAEGTAPVVFLFPGQGAAQAGFARGLYEAEPAFRDEVDRCAGVLRPHLGVDLRELMYPSPLAAQTAAARLRETRLAQPAAFTVCWALARLWGSLGVVPEAVAGQGAGELVAAAVAGAFELDDALALAAERARLVQSLPGGALLSVALAEDDLRPLLGRRISIAAAAPGACVVGGPEDELAALREGLARDGVSARPVTTSHAFHTAMMEPAVEPLRRRVAEAGPRAPATPLVSTATGRWLAPAEAADPGYWAGQVARTVRFGDALAELARVPERVFVEVGPGATLLGPVRRHPACAGRISIATLDGAGREPETARFRAAAGALWAAGAAIDLGALWHGERRRRVSLPTYPFQRKRYWVDDAPETASGHESAAIEGSYRAAVDIALAELAAEPMEVRGNGSAASAAPASDGRRTLA
jgi:acyl transferase domain-containing protein